MKATERKAALEAVAKEGFNPIMNGLGLLPGKYNLMTAGGEDIFAIKPVTSANGKKWAITLVSCVVSSLDGKISKHFGIGETDAQLALSADQWLNVEPNQKYSVEINDKGRISSIAPFTAEVEEVKEAEVLEG